jgi:hypothetical protein
VWDTSAPSSPPSCGICPPSGMERGMALRLAPGRTGSAVGGAGPPAGGAGGLQGARSRGLVQKYRLFFLSVHAENLETLLISVCDACGHFQHVLSALYFAQVCTTRGRLDSPNDACCNRDPRNHLRRSENP